MPIIEKRPFIKNHSTNAKEVFNAKVFKNFIIDSGNLLKTEAIFGLVMVRFKDGIYVSGVVKNSPASKAGFKLGDRIVKINEAEIKDITAEQAYEVLKNLKKCDFELRDLNGNERTISLTKSFPDAQ